MNFREVFSDHSAEGFLDLFEKPDEEFAKIAPFIKANVKKAYESKEWQENFLTSMEVMGVGEYDKDLIESERAEILSMKEGIKDDDTLSPEKKDVIMFMFDEQLRAFEELRECGRPSFEVKFCKLHPDAIVPEYAHPTDAGADIFALEDTTIPPHTTVCVRTGLAMAIPVGYELQIRPRSGLSKKTFLRVANAPGTIKAA